MMTIKQMEVTVREITEGYINSDEQGVCGYGGRLDIRPPYQREFIYGDKEQQAVIRTVLNGYPLNVMYWVRRSDDAECAYEVMDGQQRTLSLCEYVADAFAVDFKNFSNQPADVRRRILDYQLTVYVCEGEESEKLEWFKTINIAGKPLKEQEILNAVYAGPFVSDAKRHFSKSNCGAYRLGKDLVDGSPIRQDFLRKALEWMADHETRQRRPQSAVGYMAAHQHDPNALPLWTYFQNVLHWTISTFDMKKFKSIMNGLDWAKLYDQYYEQSLDVKALERRISKLMRDGEVQKPKGIIPYVLTGDEHYLDLRCFPEDIKLAVWERQGHRCAICGKEFDKEFMKGDHIVPWKKRWSHGDGQLSDALHGMQSEEGEQVEGALCRIAIAQVLSLCLFYQAQQKGFALAVGDSDETWNSCVTHMRKNSSRGMPSVLLDILGSCMLLRRAKGRGTDWGNCICRHCSHVGCTS